MDSNHRSPGLEPPSLLDFGSDHQDPPTNIVGILSGENLPPVDNTYKGVGSAAEGSRFVSLEMDRQDTEMETKQVKSWLKPKNYNSDLPSEPILGASIVGSSFLAKLPDDFHGNHLEEKFKFSTRSKPEAGQFSRAPPKISYGNSMASLPRTDLNDEKRQPCSILGTPTQFDTQILQQEKSTVTATQDEINTGHTILKPSGDLDVFTMNPTTWEFPNNQVSPKSVPLVYGSSLMQPQKQVANQAPEHSLEIKANQPSVSNICLFPAREALTLKAPALATEHEGHILTHSKSDLTPQPVVSIQVNTHRSVSQNACEVLATAQQCVPSSDTLLRELLGNCQDLDYDSYTSGNPHRKTSRSRTRPQMHVPFPEAALGLSHRHKHGKYSHESTQQIEHLNIHESTPLVPRTLFKDMTPSTIHVRAPRVRIERLDSESRQDGYTSNPPPVSSKISNKNTSNNTEISVEASLNAQTYKTPHQITKDLCPAAGSHSRKSAGNCSLATPGNVHSQDECSKQGTYGIDPHSYASKDIHRGHTTSRDKSEIADQPIELQVPHAPESVKSVEVSSPTQKGVDNSLVAMNGMHMAPAMLDAIEEVCQPDIKISSTQDSPAKFVIHDGQPNSIGEKITSDSSFLNKAISIIHTVSGIESRVPSPALSEVESRPPSRRSNLGKAVSRPLSAGTLQSTGNFDSRVLHSGASVRVTKPLMRGKVSAPVLGPPPQIRIPRTAEMLSDYHKFIASGARYAEILQEYEFQKELLEAQKVEIDQLNNSNQSSKRELVTLQSHKTILDERVKKLTDLGSKYKRHMNDVVKTQKFLKLQAVEFQKTAKEAVDAYTANEVVLQSIRVGIKEVRSLQASVEASVAQREIVLIDLNNKLSAKNKELSEALRVSDHEKKLIISTNIEVTCENEKLVASQERLREKNDLYVTEIFYNLDYSEKLREKITSGEKIRDMLQRDLDIRMAELSREKNSNEKLQSLIEVHIATHKELVGLLEQTPTAVASQLIKEQGILKKVENSVNASQNKIDEATNLLQTLKSQQSEIPETLMELMNGLLSRFETGVQDLDKARSSNQESIMKLIEDLKSGFDQLRRDKEKETTFLDHINDLTQINCNLVVEKTTLERDLRDLTKQLDKVKRDLVKSHEELSTKSDELVTALNILPHNVMLQERIKNLESTNDELQSRSEGANQIISKLEADVQSLIEISNCRENKMKDIEDKLRVSDLLNKSFEDERAKYVGAKELELKTLHQVAYQKFEAREEALKTNLEAEINIHKQKLTEKDEELSSLRADLTEHEKASVSTDNTISKLIQQREKDQSELQSSGKEIQRLLNANRVLETLVGALNEKCTGYESELGSLKEDAQRANESNIHTSDLFQKLDQKYRDVEDKLKTTEKETDKLIEQHKFEITAFQEKIAQQAVHLKRLEDRNPGRQDFERFGINLTLTRNEISTLRNQLKFIENNNAQRYNASKKIQLELEGRLLNIDVLEKQQDHADNQIEVLRRENEMYKEALANRLPHPQYVGHHKGSRTKFLQPTIVEDDMATRIAPINSPEASLHHTTNLVGSTSTTWHTDSKHLGAERLIRTVHGVSRSSALTSSLITPLLSSSSTLQKTVPASSQSCNTTEAKCMQSEALVLSSHTNANLVPQIPQKEGGPNSLSSRPTDFQESYVSKVPLNTASVPDDGSSPLTDSDDLLQRIEAYDINGIQNKDMRLVREHTLDHNESGPLQVQALENKKQVLNLNQYRKRSRSQTDVTTPVELAFTKEAKIAEPSTSTYIQSPAKKLRMGTNTCPSIEEESLRRRTSKPAKGALKIRPVVAATRGTEEAEEKAVESQRVKPLLNGPLLRRNENQQSQHHSLSKFKGYVSGNPPKLSTMVSSQHDDPKGHIPQSTTNKRQTTVARLRPVSRQPAQNSRSVIPSRRRSSLLTVSLSETILDTEGS